GQFRESKREIFTTHAEFEDIDAGFADVDGNGSIDLIVDSGGNNRYAEKRLYQTRIYLNNGNGEFSPSATEIPSTHHNAAVINASDFNQDGAIDLFVGARSVPGIYGISPDHQLLENDGKGNFK